MRASIAAVEALIAREHERGVPSERIVLAGFSQGGAIALAAGLRHAETTRRHRGAFHLSAAGRHAGGRAQRGQRRDADLLGPRHRRPGGGAAARPGFARRAGGAGLHAGLAYLPDAALGLRRGNRRPAPLVRRAPAAAERPAAAAAYCGHAPQAVRAPREYRPLPDFCRLPALFALLLVGALTVTLMWLAPDTRFGWRGYSVGMLFVAWLSVLIAFTLCKVRPWLQRLSGQLPYAGVWLLIVLLVMRRQRGRPLDGPARWRWA